MITTKCSNCQENIDKGACGDRFSVFIVHDDRENRNVKTKYTFCNGCTAKMLLRL